MGFSDEMDLTRRVGVLERDDSPAFRVPHRPIRRPGPCAVCRPNRRCRGVLLDRCDDGVWRSELSWTDRGGPARPASALDERPGAFCG